LSTERLEFPIFASAARTETVQSDNFLTNVNRTLLLYWDMTVNGGAETVTPYFTPTFQDKDTSETLISMAGRNAPGRWGMIIGNGQGHGLDDPDSWIEKRLSIPLPTTWSVLMIHAGAGSATYSVHGIYL
jgi:hypothetical protein